MLTLSELLNETKVQCDDVRLDVYQRNYLKAKIYNDAEAFRALARVVIAALPTGVHSQRGIEKLVRIYFGSKITLVSARTDLHCRDAQVRVFYGIAKQQMIGVREGLKETLENIRTSK